MDMTQHVMQFIHDYNYFQRNQPPAPPLKEVVIDHDKITFQFAEIPRRSFADGTRRPIIDEYKIEWKKSKKSRWNTICTKSSNLLGFTLYLKHPKFKDRVTGLVDNHWHEYAFFRSFQEEFDVRVYAYNQSDKDIEPYTFVKLKLFEHPPCRSFEDYCNTPPEIVNYSTHYLIGQNPQKLWTNHANKLCQLTHIRPLSWTFVKPRKGWNIDGYLFDGEQWIDTNLQSAYNTLIQKNQSNDIIYQILQSSHLGRLCGDIPDERRKALKEFVFRESSKNTEKEDEDV